MNVKWAMALAMVIAGLATAGPMHAQERDGGINAKFIRRIEWPNNHLFITAVSADSKLYLAGGDTGTLRIWEMSSGDQVQELPVWAGVFTPDGKHVVGHAGDKSVRRFEVASGKEVDKWAPGEAVVSLTLSSDGKRVLTGHSDKVLRIWELETGKELCKMVGHTEPASAIFAPDGNQVLSASAGDKSVRLWDAKTGKLLHEFDSFSEATPIEGHGLILQPLFVNGKQAAAYSWGKKKEVLVWDLGTKKLKHVLNLGDDHHKDVAASPDGRWVISGHEDRTVRLIDVASGKELQRFEMTDTNVPRALLFSPDGRYVVAGSFRSWVYLWQVRK